MEPETEEVTHILHFVFNETGSIIDSEDQRSNLNSSFFILHSSFKKFAFSGIHIFSPRLFPLLENYPDKFGIMDFYLGADSGANIKGYLKNDLRLMDVGKLDTLKDAEEFLKECDM